MKKPTGKDAVAAAEKRLREAKEYLDSINPFDTPPVLIEKRKQEFQQAEQEYRRLHFLFIDHAPSHEVRLRAINAANREFYGGTK